MSGETFTCAACRRTFPKVLTDEEATAQTADQVRGTPEDTATVCEPCYERIVVWHRMVIASDGTATVDGEPAPVVPKVDP